MQPNEWEELVPGVSTFSNAELDRKLEEAAALNQKSEKLICCFLAEIHERGAFREFGFDSIYDYAMERFGFKERKTRYLLYLGRKVQDLPQIREALRSGKLGWCKATRIASVATRQDETMWLDSALSLSVAELDRRIQDGTDRMASMLRLWLTEDVRVLWENGLEIARRVAGVELSPVQAFEYMVAEFLATWGNGGAPAEECGSADRVAAPPIEPDLLVPQSPPLPLFAETETSIDARLEERFRKLILERDGWKCRYPGCNARKELHVHHIEFRSHGGPDEAWNGIVLCAFHHELLHTGHISVKGRAPHELAWTPPKLIREVLDRRRNRPALWVGELEVREFPEETPDDSRALEDVVLA
jgi:hypothetical protein